MKTPPRLYSALAVILCCVAGAAQGADVYKENNTTDLNLSGSWVGGNLPGPSDIAIWDNVGGTVALGGDLSVLGIRSTGAGGTRTIDATVGATLTIGSAGVQMVDPTSNTFNLDSAVHLSADQTWIAVESRFFTVGKGGLTGNIVWTIQGEGRLDLGVNNAFSGTYNIDGGNVRTGGTANRLGGIVNLSNGGTLDVRGATQTTYGLNGDETSLVSRVGTGSTRLVVETETDDHFAGAIENIALTKSGSGSLTLTGSVDVLSSNSSAVIVSGGTLLISEGGEVTATPGGSNPAVEVSAGATLGGNGGTINGSVTAADGSAFGFVLSDPLETNLVLIGELTFLGDVDLKLSLDHAPVANDTYTLLSGAGVSAADAFATINGAAFGPNDTFVLSFEANDYEFQLLYGAGSISAQVVPEPSSLLLVLSFGSIVIWRTLSARSRKRLYRGG